MRSASRTLFSCAAAAALIVAGASTARATFTTVNPPTGEETHAEILSHIYGGTFHATGLANHDYTNGSITAERVEDATVSTQNLNTGLSNVVVGNPTPDDQLWLADYKLASAKAKYAVYNQEFGYYDGAVGGTYTKLFDQTGWGYNVNGDADLSRLSGHLLRWARGGEARVVSSQQFDNADAMDHMVTYNFVNNTPTQPVSLDTTLKVPPSEVESWLLFWEDKFKNEALADFDFNDLVVEVKASAIPEPTSLASLAAVGLMGAGMTRKRSRKSDE